MTATTTTTKIKTWLPVFPGFYNTLFGPQFDNELQDLKEQGHLPDTAGVGDLLWGWDNPGYETAVVKAICESLTTRRRNPYFPPEAGIINCELEQIVSPKEYNFVNDSANVTFEIDLALFAPWIRAYLKDNAKAWEDHLFRHYRSRDGFISCYPHDPAEWQPFIDALLDGQEMPETHGWHSRGIPEEHLLGRLLEFYLLNEDEETDMKMYYDVGDCVYVSEFIDLEKAKEHLKKE